MRRALSLALALLLSSPARADDAGVPDAGSDVPVAFSVRTGSLVLDDGSKVDVDGGFYGNDALLFDFARTKASLQAENDALRKTPAPLPSTVVWGIVLGAAAGLAGGIVVGVEFCKLATCR